MAVMKIEYTRCYIWGDEEMVALFDDQTISEEEVSVAIRLDREHPHIIITPKTTYESVFKSLIGAEIKYKN